MKKSLQDAGIDEQFKAHSTRAASAIATATSGVSTKIMSGVGWLNEHTFTKFYYKLKGVADYSGAILQTCKETC